MSHLMSTEAPAFIVVASALYRALTIAAGKDHISLWYPRIVAKVRAEVQEGLHGFIRWLNSNSTRVSACSNSGGAGFLKWQLVWLLIAVAVCGCYMCFICSAPLLHTCCCPTRRAPTISM